MSDNKFLGFPVPRENWSKLPHVFIEALPVVKTVGELKCILYILRHTWGFQDKDKKITIDEFMHGRKRRNESRLDGGTGLSKTTVLAGLKQAEAHGFIVVEIDDSDKGRIKKYYSLRMQDTTPGVQKLYLCGRETIHRTEKETLERNDDDDGRPAASIGDHFLAFYSLVYLGIDADIARTEANQCDPDLVLAWCASLQYADATNLPGLVLSKLRAEPPTMPVVYDVTLDGFKDKVRKAIPDMRERLDR